MTEELLDRLPPKAIDAERLLLGSIVVFPDCAPDVFRQLPAVDFADQAHQAIYAKMQEHHTRGLAVDPPMIGAELKGHSEFPEGASAFLLELGQEVVTVANVDCYVKKIRDASLRRQLFCIGTSTIEGAMNGQPAIDTLRSLIADVDDCRRIAVADKPRFQLVSAAEMAVSEYPLDYIVERLLVESQFCTLGGPKKALKTTLAIVLGVCIAAAEPFLGKFTIPRRRRVAIYSCESGMATIKDIALRVCASMGLELAEIDGLTFCDRVPKLHDSGSVADFRASLEDSGAEVCFLDALYRMVTGEGAENFIKMGALCGVVDEVCKELAVTPIVCHHLKTGRLNQYDPADIDDLAYSGCAEFTRQWILLSRREAYEDGSGLHRLWMRVGGSAGHNSLWAVDANEGSIDDVGGRHWATTIQRADEARNAANERRAEAKSAETQRQIDEDRAKVCRLLAKHPSGATKTFIRDHCGVSSRRWPATFAAMYETGELVTCEVQVSNHKTSTTGYKLNMEDKPE